MTRQFCIAAVFLLGVGEFVFGETMTVIQFLKQKDKWPDWSRRKTVLTISGRYEGRVAKQFRLEKFPALITPQRTTVLPPDVARGQRLSITGAVKVSGTRLSFEAARIASGTTDLARLDAKTAKINRKEPQEIYQLAEEFEPIADFYKDQDLVIRLRQLRKEAFQQQRTLSQERAL